MNKYNLVEKGVTTEAELLSLMGQPQLVQRNSNVTTYLYIYAGSSHYSVHAPAGSVGTGNVVSQHIGFTVKEGVVIDKSEMTSNMGGTHGSAVAPIVP